MDRIDGAKRVRFQRVCFKQAHVRRMRIKLCFMTQEDTLLSVTQMDRDCHPRNVAFFIVVLNTEYLER